MPSGHYVLCCQYRPTSFTPLKTYYKYCVFVLLLFSYLIASMFVFISKNAKHQKYEREAHFYRTDIPKSSVISLKTIEWLKDKPSKFELPGPPAAYNTKCVSLGSGAHSKKHHPSFTDSPLAR